MTNVGTIAGGTFAESSTVTSRHSITGGEFRGKVNNSNGIISGGIFTSTSEVTNNGQIQAAENEMSEPTFLGKVTNDTSGMIHAGQFDGTVTNSGYISGGTFTATSDVTNNASITSGTFECPVTNNDSISGGEFKDTVTNSANGTILGESIFHKVVENSGTIRGGTFEDAVNDYEGFTITGGVFKTPTLDDIELHTVSSTDKLQYGEVSKNLKVSIPEAKKYKFANASFEIKNEDGDVVDDYSMPGTYTYHVVVTDYDLLPKTHVLTDDAWTFTIEGTPLEFDSDGVPVYGNAPHDADGINYYGEGWTYDCVNHVLTLDASIVLSQLNGYKTCSVYTKITSPDEDDPTQAVTVDATGFTFSEDVSVGKNCTLIGATLNGKMSVYNEGTLTDCTAAAVCTVTNNGTIASGSYSGYVYNYDTIAGGSFRGYVTNQGSITSGTFSYGVSNEGKGTITGGNFITGSSVSNSSIISGGSFLGEVNNNDTGTITATETTTPDFTGTVNNGGKIEDGTFSGIVKNSNTITGGSYDNTVLNAGTIQDGTFLRDVENAGTIAGGEFRGKVNNKEGAAITGGTFTEDGSVVNDGDITKSADGTTGTFKGPVENNGTISAGTFTNFVTGDGKITGGNFIPMAIDLTVENIPEEPVAPSALNLFPKLNNDEKFDPDSLTILYEKVGTTVQAYASVRDDLADNDDEAYTETAPTIPGTYKFRVQLKDNAGTTYTVKNDAWQFTIKGEPLHIVDGEPDLTFAATEDGKTYYGDGWVYDKDEKELTLTGDITFADNTTEIDVDVDVAKGATVSGGRFMENVSNKGTIEGATFEKKVTNEGTISDSHLSGSASMDNKTTGRITDTTFTSSVITNEGSIIGGSVDGGTLVDNGKMTDVEGVTTISGTGGDIYVNGTEETLKGHSVLTGDSIKLVAHDEENFVRWIIDSDGRELGGADFGLDTEENFQAKITQPEFTFTVKSDWRTVNFMVQQPASDDASLQEIAMGVGLATVAVGGAVFIYEAATTRYLYDHLPDHAVPATRAELALVLWQAAGKPEPAAPAVYSDVTDADTAKAARWAVEAGLISDKGETTFAPNRRITKIQAIQAWNKLQKSSK